MTKSGLLAAATLLAMIPAQVRAEDGLLQEAIGSERFQINGSVRLRYETYDGSFRPSGALAAEMGTIRTSIKASYDFGSLLIGGELRDARGYLNDIDTPFNSGDVNALEPIQAYVTARLRGVLGKGSKTDLTAGRFVLNLGSRRLVGDPSGRSAGNGFAGLNLERTGKDKSRLVLFYTYAQQRRPGDRASLLENRVVFDRATDDQEFWGGFGSLPLKGTPLVAELYAYGMDEADRPGVATRNRHLITPGFRLLAKPRAGKLDAELEVMHQRGNVRQSTAASAARVPVNANSTRAVIGYSFAASWTPRLSLTIDHASGDDTTSRSFNRFDALYGLRDSDWSPTGLFGPLGRANINSIAVRAEASPGKRVNGFVEWRKSALEEATDSFASTGLRDSSGRSGRDGGDQFLAKIRYDLVPGQITADIGGAVMAKGRFLRDAPNSQSTRDTHYVVMDLTFKI